VPIRENTFARRAREREREESAATSKRVVFRDQQPTIDEQLARLEEDIRRLKVEFDIYFNGAAKRPPYDTKGRVDTLIKRLADERTLTFAQRYHYNSLAARYNSFMQLWRRTMQEREEGRGPSRRPAPAPRQEPEPAPATQAEEQPAPKTAALYPTSDEVRQQVRANESRLGHENAPIGNRDWWYLVAAIAVGVIIAALLL